MCLTRNPIHCLVPPNVLEEVARRGNDKQRDWALRTLSRDNTIRSARLQNARRRGRGPREGADTLAQGPPGQLSRLLYHCQNKEKFPIRPERVEGDDPRGDDAVDEAYDGFGDTHRFFWEVHHRDSTDDEDVLGKDPQPAHMDDFVVTTRDNAGVHINSGIPNHAFYTVATTLGGHAWERAGVIWYETLRDPLLRTNADYQSFADLSCATAARLYGADGEEVDAVRAGWDKV